MADIIPETCEAIHKVLARDYKKTPSSAADWKEIAKGFLDMYVCIVFISFTEK